MSIEQQQQWLATPLGNYLQAQEQVLFDNAVSDVFGFNALQLGMFDVDLLRNSRMPFCFKAGVSQGKVNCDSCRLPFSPNSIDLLLLPHVLEFSTSPHQTLREAERVLLPEGHIMVTGFNPLSLWGLNLLVAKHKTYPWNGHFITLSRIKDWLELLSFEMVSCTMICYPPPLKNSIWLQKFQFMDLYGSRWWPMMGGVYFIVAKKRVLGMTLIRPNWKPAKLQTRLVPTPSQKSDKQKKQHG
jgi:hypothetical protein